MSLSTYNDTICIQGPLMVRLNENIRCINIEIDGIVKNTEELNNTPYDILTTYDNNNQIKKYIEKSINDLLRRKYQLEIMLNNNRSLKERIERCELNYQPLFKKIAELGIEKDHYLFSRFIKDPTLIDDYALNSIVNEERLTNGQKKVMVKAILEKYPLDPVAFDLLK